ncbi:MAG TPA: RraA family protein [Steroidobacteraceae bacterium]|nr:RraA family protein [Steroidobacteraceae bacterium]
MNDPTGPGIASQRRERVQRLRRLDACAVSDALDKLGLPGVVSHVPQLSGDQKIAGAIVTLKVGVGTPPPGPPRHLGTRAIEVAGSDHVIVIEQRSGIDAGCWGGLLTLGARMREVAGVIADGPVRDIDEARAYGFPVFTRALTARTARGRVVELGTNVPIRPWEQPVEPEDFVIADRSAVVFISGGSIDAVLEAAEAIAAREAAMAKALLAGTAPAAVMAGNYENMLKGSS